MKQTARRIAAIALFTMTVPTAPALAQREECTTAVLGPTATVSGAPVLWKNRDTNTLSNRVVYVDEQPFAYLCLANGDDPSGRRCFAGLNSEGFAIMNTVAYNLPEVAGEAKDHEGTIMADALRTCSTVEDFASYLEANRGDHLGSQGREKVRRWVLEEGKGVVGICAGGYLLSSTPAYKWSLRLISADVIDRAHYNRGRGLMEIAFTDDSRQIFPEIGADMPTFLQYYDGPVLVRSSVSALPAYDELAIYVSDIHLGGGSSAGVTPGKTALLVNDAGEGKVAVCVGHPESTPGMRWMIPRMARMVANRTLVDYSPQVVRPSRETQEILFDADRSSEERKLFWQLVGDDPEEKIGALRALVEMRSRPALRWAQGLLRDDDPRVRRLAGSVLEEAEYTPAIDDLSAAVQLEPGEVLREALQGNLDALERIAR